MPWRVGDAIVLLQPVALVADDSALDAMLEMLIVRGFLRSTPIRVDAELEAALRDVCAREGCGCRVLLDHDAASGALITCAPHAHLALSTVVERGRTFRAEAIGVVTAPAVDIRRMHVQ